MKIVEFEGQTRLLGAPKGWDQKGGVECGFLPVEDVNINGVAGIRSYWKPTPEEIKLLQAGYYIALDVIGPTTSPVCISVGDCKELP